MSKTHRRVGYALGQRGKSFVQFQYGPSFGYEIDCSKQGVIARTVDARYAHRSLGRRLSPLLVSVIVFLLALPGCGVRFSEDSTPDPGDMFQKMELTGDKTPGSELTLTLVLKQNYPVPVRVACYYEDSSKLTDDQEKVAFEERATRIYDEVLPPSPETKPGEDISGQMIDVRFRVAEAGDYFLACNTPAATENGKGLGFKIRPVGS